MRVAGLLLALVLVTSCFVGGTFAKYVTHGGGSDVARVAKFGVVVTGSGDEAVFATKYEEGANTPISTTGTVSVAAGNGKDHVVAPGTKSADDGILMTTVTGTPEVKVKVEYGAAVSLSGNWHGDEKGTFYCPLIIKVGTTEIKGIDCTSAEDFNTKVQNAIIALGNGKTYDAGTDLSKVNDLKTKISWEWPFEQGATEKDKGANDLKDTYLGGLAAKITDPTDQKMPKVHITVTTTVTQVD